MLGVVGFPTDDPKCTYLHMERVLFCSADRPAEKSYGESMLLTTRKRMVLDTKISRYHFMGQEVTGFHPSVSNYRESSLHGIH